MSGLINAIEGVIPAIYFTSPNSKIFILWKMKNKTIMKITEKSLKIENCDGLIIYKVIPKRKLKIDKASYK